MFGNQLLAMVVTIEQLELEKSLRKYVILNNELDAELINKEDDVLKKISEANETIIHLLIVLIQI